jgi:chromosome segregation ATPase
MSKSNESALVIAARALADDLQRFEQLSGELTRSTINSDKSLQRARRGLEECSAQEAKLVESLRGFARAMQGVQELQQRCMDQTALAAERIRQRQEARAQLQQRLQSLGESARDVSAPLEAVPSAGDAEAADMRGPLREVGRRLEPVIAEAAELTALAKKEDWSDLERDTHTLEQQLQAARNRVLLSLRKLAEDAPS